MADQRTGTGELPKPALGRGPLGKNVLRIAIAVLVGAALGVGLWDPLRIDERAHVQRVTRLAVRSLQADISADMESEILAVIRLAKQPTLDERPTPKELQSNAKLFLSDHPSYVAIVWVDPKEAVDWIVSRDDGKSYDVSADKLLRPALQTTLDRRTEDATVTPAFRMANGEWGSRIIVRVHKDDRLLGSLVAVFELRKALHVVLADHSELGYDVVVLEGDHQLYRMHGWYEDKDNFAQEAEVRLRGATWHIRVWPEPELLRQVDSKLPEITLTVGALLGILLVLTVYFARRAHINARQLQRANDEMEIRVEQRATEVHELSGRLLQSQDEERRRIARELHDSTTQVLAGAAFYLEKAHSLVSRKDNGPGASGAQRNVLEALDNSSKFLDDAVTEVRTISYLLHPPMLDDLGLAHVIRWFATGFTQRTGIRVDLDLQPDVGRLPRKLEVALFRIVQEALTNVHRHSGSASAEVSLTVRGSQVTLEIADQGRGLALGAMDVAGSRVAALGVGIRGMRERVRQLGGALEIRSSSLNQGTVVRAVLPILDPEMRDGAHPNQATERQQQDSISA